MPALKEPDILHKAKTVDEARRLYLEHFSGASEGQICGEASTYYTMLPTFTDISELARQVCPDDVKLIYLMRDPIERIRSHLSHDFMVGRLRDANFDRAVREDPRYISWSDYAMQARPWIQEFGLDRILFLSFENFAANRLTTIRRVFIHLGLNIDFEVAATRISNERGSQRASHSSTINRVLQSNFYQARVRKTLPDWLILASKNLLTRRRAIPTVSLSQETLLWLTEKFSNQQNELRKIGVSTYPGQIDHTGDNSQKNETIASIV